MHFVDIKAVYDDVWTVVDAAVSTLRRRPQSFSITNYDNSSSNCDNASLELLACDDTQSSDSHYVPGLITALLHLIEREDYDAIAELKFERQTTDQLPPAQTLQGFIDRSGNVNTVVQGVEQTNEQPKMCAGAQKTPNGEMLEELTSWQVLRVKRGLGC